jgi:hypothetical protein
VIFMSQVDTMYQWADTIQVYLASHNFSFLLNEYCTVNNLPQAKTLFAVLQDYEARLMKVYGSKQKDRS